jgi:hypothetical protein
MLKTLILRGGVFKAALKADLKLLGAASTVL